MRIRWLSSNLLSTMIFCILCVSITLWVGQYTAVFTGHDSSHRTGVAVCAGRGTVCQKPTLGIPVENPSRIHCTWTALHIPPFGALCPTLMPSACPHTLHASHTHAPQPSPGPQPWFGHIWMHTDMYLHISDLFHASSPPLCTLRCTPAPPLCVSMLHMISMVQDWQ